LNKEADKTFLQSSLEHWPRNKGFCPTSIAVLYQRGTTLSCMHQNSSS